MKTATIDIARIETMFEVAMQNDEITTMCIPNEYVSLALATYLGNDYTIDILDIDNADYDEEYFVSLDNIEKTFSIEQAIKAHNLKGIEVYNIETDNFYIVRNMDYRKYKTILDKAFTCSNANLIASFFIQSEDEEKENKIITGVKEDITDDKEYGVYITINL